MAYGLLGLKPNEFWELYPRDIILMNEGFQMQREYDEKLHLETLRILRYNAYCTYISIPTKKGVKKSKLEQFYPLPYDRKERLEITDEEREAFFAKKDPVIENGKLRGYMVNGVLERIN